MIIANDVELVQKIFDNVPQIHGRVIPTPKTAIDANGSVIQSVLNQEELTVDFVPNGSDIEIVFKPLPPVIGNAPVLDREGAVQLYLDNL